MNALGWFVLGIYGLIGILRFTWAMNRLSSWDRNIESQNIIKRADPFTLVVILLFETFLWPVELALGFYFLAKDRKRARKSKTVSK